MENVNWSQILTAIVAIYGAILSTMIFTSRRREKQRRLKVNFSNGFLTYAHNLSKAMLFITISNPGNRDVTINVPSISLPDGKPLVFPNPQSNVSFPYKLEEGTECKIWTEIKDLARQLKENWYYGIIRLKAKVEDGSGQIYKSKDWKINLDNWTS
jgi:hypothetical protein